MANALTAAGDAATRAQQETLVKYVGWGGLKGAFRDPKTGLFNRDLAQVGSELEQVLTPEEYETAERSIQYAHYTAEPVVRGMWDAMRRLGFEGGTVFEPGMGVGHFLGMMPSDLADNSQYRGVEMDGVSARIARLLYPESGVQHADFRETPLPHGEFDIAIGNPPFARTVIASDPQYANNGFVLHDYFIAKSLDSVRPGGLLAMVTSAGTMNKAGDDARRYFAERANFLGAIRLPGGTFGENANTQVTTDIIFLQRRPEGRVPLDKAGDTSWTETVIRELPDREGNPIEGHVSRYFTEHAEMVLGEEGFFDQTVAGARYGVRPLEGHDLEKDLAAAIDRLPQNVMVERPSAEEQRIRDFDSGQTKDGSFYMKDGRLMQYRGGVGEPVVFRGPGVKGGMTAEDRARVTHLIPIRDALREVYRHDLADNTEEATKARAALNTAYDKFVEKFGPLNKAVIRYERPKAPQMERLRQEMREEMRERGEFFDPGSFDATPLLEAGQTLTQVATAREQARAAALAAGRQWNEGTFEPEEAPDNQIDQRPNMRPFRGDPEAERLRSIEDYNDITGEARKKTIFFEPTVRRELEPKLETAYDGLLWSLNQFGRLDLPRIAERMNRDHHSLLAELGDAVFRVPGAPDTYETAENYLSGDVVSKAKEVEARVRSEPDLQRNLEALRRVRPPLIPPERISYALGMPWIEPSSYQDFAESLGLGRPRFVRIPALGQWRIEESRNASTTGLATWGTNRMNAWRILDHAFNRVQPVVWDQIDRNTRVVNATATEAAVTKVAELQEAFQSWAREGDHGVALSDRYNDQMNRVTPWKGNGDYLKTPGVNIAWKWRPHQKRAIARIIQRGNTYLAHGVGAGKAQPLDAKILTPRGWTRMGALQVGDVVIAGDGSPTRVVGVFPQGEKEIFRVRFSDGSETECCDEHLWLTQTFDERTRASAGRKAGKSWRCALPKVRALADIRSTLLDPRLGSKNHTIPIVGAVQFESTATALDPYLLGVLIGDGSLRQDGVSLSTADDELLNAVRAALPPGCEAVHVGAYDWRLRYNGARMYAAGRGGWLPSNPIITEMRRTGLQGTHSHSKFLPPDYLFNSVEARTSLLQGLMDTDGWVQAAGTSIYFSTASERLADDVTTLVQSLGGTVSRRIKNTAYTHRGLRLAGRPSHVLCLKLPNSVRPFRLSRKAEKVRNKTKYGPVRYVVDVQPVGRKAAQCIAVAHPSHLYVTDDFIVTHNTSEMIGAAMEMKRLGLVNKPMIIVPNHMLRQFTTEWYDLYPTARLSVADETQFEKDVRRQFVANMAQDDLDGVVLTHSAFQKIPISREFNTRMLREQIAELVAAMRSAGNDRTTRAQLQQQMERLREKLSKMVSNTKDQTLTWEETGVDFLFVDEAHYFRKLDFVTQMANLKGITPSGSDMAWDLYTKARYLDTLRPGRSLVLASGTPITNTMGELYSVSRYLQPQALRDRGLSHFDSWAQAFGTTASSLEQQPDGSFKPVTRFNRFLNTPELYAMVSGVMDVVTGEELGTLVNRPKLAGGRRRLVLAERGERLAAYQVELAGRMEAIRKRTGKPQKGDDIMLSVINDGRLAALDMRFIDGPGVSFLSNRREPSKLDLAVDNIHKIWQETQDHQFYDPSTDYQTPAFKGPAAQMVFANFGVNRSGPGDWSAYEHLKRALVAKGIPEDEIAFIKDAKTHIARQRLFNDINLGKKRILIGSTQKMGTGVNAQKRLVAIHNLDPLWFPADDEQRVGRGLRQGNFSRDLHVIDYTTKGTYDATMWGMMAKKGRFVEDFFRGDPSLRDIADIGEASMYEQAAAMTISDPRVIELAEVNDELRRLERQRDAHNSRQNQLRGEAKWLRDQADADDAAAARIDELLPKLKRTRGDEFEMTVGSETFKKRADAAAALRDETKRVVEKAVETANDRPLWLGELGGLPLYVQALFSRDGKLNYVSFSLRLDKDSIRQVSSPRDENSFGGMIQSAETIINGLFDEPAWLRRNAVEKRGKAADLDKVIGQKFPRAAEIAPLKARSEELARAIQAPPPKKETPATEGGPNEEAPWPNVDADEMLGPNAPFFMRRDVPLYSAVERAAADLRQAKGSGEQMLAAIQRTPGVRQEELEWIGLPAWLREQKSVTRDQITEFVRANRVDVQEVTKGFDDAKHQEQLAEIKRLEGEWDQHERRIRELRPRVALEPGDTEAGRAAQTALRELVDSQNAINERLSDVHDAIDQDRRVGRPKYREHALSGGQNYRELLLTLPPKEKPKAGSLELLPNGKWVVRDPSGMRELFATEEAAERHRERMAEVFPKSASVPSAYQSSHWNEPNVLAHVRFDDRVAPDGSKVLMVQEVQSDWHQEGRKAGYRKPVSPAEVAALRERVERLEKEHRALAQAYNLAKDAEDATFHEANQPDSSWRQSADRMGAAMDAGQAMRRRRREFASEDEFRAAREAAEDNMLAEQDRHRAGMKNGEFPEWVRHEDAQRAARAAHRVLEAKAEEVRAAAQELDAARGAGRSGVPDAPFKTSWPSLVMRRMIKYAVDNGYDRIAWSPGEVHADRYALANQINSLDYAKDPDGGGYFVVFQDRRGEHHHLNDEKPIPASRLRDFVGEEVAQKIINNEGRGPPEARTLSGLDLRVGGEGMKGFYDRILPAEVNAIVKKFGTKVERGAVTRGVGKGEWDDIAPDEEAMQKYADRWQRFVERARALQDRRQELPPGPERDQIDNELRDVTSQQDILHRQMVSETGNRGISSPVHQFDITPRMRAVVAQEGLPLFVRPEEQAPHAAPDPGAVQAFIDEANRLTGGHMQIEAYDAAHDVFTIRFKVGDGERTEQVAGYVWGKLLRAAIEPDATRTQWNFDHETGHALRALGLITDKEWAALMDAAKREKWHERYGIDRRYPDAEPWLRDEEAFVEAMADARFRPPPSDSVLARIIAKIKAFFARLRNLLAGRGYQTAEDIFGRIYEGEVGRREPGSEGPMRGPATAEESVKEAADFNRMTFSRRPTDTPERREDMATRVDARARLEAVPRIGRALAAVYDAARTTGQLAERATHELLFPMRLGSPVAQAVAQRFANQLREIGERYGRLDRDWQERFSPMERRHMAHAMTNQSLFEVMLREDLNGMPEEERASYEAEARRLFNADGHGLAGLPTDLRETLEAADEINATVWQMLGDVGLVQPGAQRIPFYFPRQGVLGEEGLPYRLPSSADEVPRADDEESGGRRGERRRATAMEPTGLNLTASGPMRRHWLKWEDTEAAGRARFGENFKLVDDVRMLTHAWARAERAVVGRELVDQIKAYGEESNLEWVREGARPARGQWFTLDHPAMMRWVPKWPQHPDADGKIAPMRDPEGNIIYERQPIHISTDFKGPLQAVLSDAPGMWYKGAMMLKGASMHAIMWNPLKHLQVEIGRAFPLLPRAIVTPRSVDRADPSEADIPAIPLPRGGAVTLEWIKQGSQEIADRAAMKEWIGRYGISPIGQGWGLDPATVMEQAEAPYGRIPGLVALRQLADNAARTVGRKLGPVAEKIARHPQQELLWNMVYRLQMAIAVTMRDRFMEGGLDRDTASFASAYLANRFAGALPPEHLSKWANQLSNILMFSRSFTLGNLGVGKDAVKGPPQQIVSLIAHELGPEKAAQAAAAIKQAAKGAFIADMGLFYVFNGLMQSGIKYAATLAAGAAALGAAKSMFDDWLEDARIALTEEYDPFRLLPQQWNEEGKTDRIYLYTDATGRGVYVRPSIGKVGEDLVGWGAHPSKMVQNKASPHFKSLVEAILGKDAFGRAIRNPHPHGVGEWAEAIYDSTKHAIVTPFVPDVAGPIGAIANGTAAQDPFGTFLETAFMLSGFGTISHGASPREPGMSGPETGEKYAEMERLDWMRQTVMKKANPYIRRGDLSKASEIIQESRLPEPEKVQMLRRLRPATTLSPTTRRLIESGWDASRTTGARQ